MKDYKADNKKFLAQNTVYKMVQVSEKLNLTPRAIRYYESEGLLGDVKRSIGYTRYFTETDLDRLLEIKALKKEGKRISEIKAIFSEQYQKETQLIQHDITIEDMFIEKDDIAFCVANGIQIQPMSLCIQGVTMDYMNWRNVDITTFLQPFDIVVHQANQRYKESNIWVGNAKRCVLNATLNDYQTQPLTTSQMAKELTRCIEWLIMPVQVTASVALADGFRDYVLLEKRVKTGSERHILPKKEAVLLFEKQFKQMVVSANGRVMFVTIHRLKDGNMSNQIEACILELVSNKNRLSIEDIAPVYLKNVGTLDAVFISALPGV